MQRGESGFPRAACSSTGHSLDPAIHLQLLALSDLRPQASYSAFLHPAILREGGNWIASQLALAIS